MSLRIFKSDAFRLMSALAMIFLFLATLASGTSETGDMPQIIDHAMASQVDESTSQVGTRTNTFQTGDVRAYSWVSFGSIYGAHLVEWKWYSPNGALYESSSVAIPDSRPVQDSWELYNVYYSIDIAGTNASSQPGNWHVDIFMDGQEILTEQFTIATGPGQSESILGQTEQIWVNGSSTSTTVPGILTSGSMPQILDHSMASQVDESTGRATIRANTFQTGDIRAYSWVKFGSILGAHLVEWKWYSPNGALYESAPVAIPDSKPNYDRWEWYDSYSSIDIAGSRASSLTGNWHVDIFMDGQKILTEQFTIATGSGPSESILGQTEQISLNGSSTSLTVPGTLTSGSTPQILDHSMGSQVDESTGRVTTRAATFQTSDSKAYSWVKFGSILGAHLVEWKWYSPDGALYESTSDAIPDSKPNYDSWDWYDIYSSIDIAGSRASSLTGNWHVDIFMDGQKILTEQFTIATGPGPSETTLVQPGQIRVNGSSTSLMAPGTLTSGSMPQILDHSMGSQVDESTGRVTTRAATFQTSDSKAYSWVKFGSILGAHLVEWKWYSPNGALYESSSVGIPDSKPNYDSWEWYDIYASIDIAGSKASSLIGNWHVEIFLDGQKILTEQFNIRFAGRTPLQLGSFSQEECYTDPATGRTSCTSYGRDSYGSSGVQRGCYTDPATGQIICMDSSSSLFSSQHIVM